MRTPTRPNNTSNVTNLRVRGSIGYGAPPSVSKSPSPSIADGGISDGSTSRITGDSVGSTRGEAVSVGVCVGVGVGVGVVGVAVVGRAVVGRAVVGAAVVGAAVVMVGEAVAGDRLGVGVDVTDAVGLGWGSSPRSMAAHSAPAPSPTAIAATTAMISGSLDFLGSSEPGSGSWAGGMAIVG